ncbi:MAG TPA: maleylpyruvate isomerase N-terminal domain-containing protein [Acidimicrobiales bacterium]|nr:maleylpyruvate isomerase N-terminal domain-containing protein [Acidimicrobiales bacterium]
MTDPSWDFRDPACQDRLLGVLRREIDDTFALVHGPAAWDAPTACAGWGARDVIGHLVDTTEGYLPAFDIARNGGTAPQPHGLRIMSQLVDEGAKAFRKVPQDELLDRLRDDAHRMLEVFDGLSAEDWGNLLVPHNYMGPLPAMFYPIFQLVDYTVHSWDIRQGQGQGGPHGITGDAADLLVPLIFILWGATADTSAVTAPYSVGIRVSGVNGGDTRADVTSEGVQFTPGSIDDCPATLEFDPATLTLVAYGRINGGTVRGDRATADQFRRLFFAI